MTTENLTAGQVSGPKRLQLRSRVWEPARPALLDAPRTRAEEDLADNLHWATAFTLIPVRARIRPLPP